jgi:hypothetical protein
VEIGGQPFSPTLLSGARLGAVGRSWLAYDPVLVLAGLLGLVLLLRGPLRPWALVLVVAPALCFAAVFLLYDGSHVRYLLPASLLLAPGAAALLAALSRRGPLGGLLALALVALPLVQAARLDWLLGREDTRSVAARELPALIPADAVVAVDGMGSQYGPPLVPRAGPLRRVAALGLWLNRTEQRVLDSDDAGLPQPPEARRLLPIGRFWQYDSYYPGDYLPGPPESLADWMDAWDVDVYVQVDRVPDPARRQPVTTFTGSRGSLMYSVSPTGSDDPDAAELPTDMSFALTQLWRYERPGPWIRAWRIARAPDGGGG